MLKCLIAFILGYLSSRMMGNGFSIGGGKQCGGTGTGHAVCADGEICAYKGQQGKINHQIVMDSKKSGDSMLHRAALRAYFECEKIRGDTDANKLLIGNNREILDALLAQNKVHDEETVAAHHTAHELLQKDFDKGLPSLDPNQKKR